MTRYRVEDGGATGPLDRYSRSTRQADRSTALLRSNVGLLSGRMGTVVRLLGPAAAGMGVLGVAVFGLRRVFGNLNVEMNSTIQLASQINLAANFSPDPVENFNRSMEASRGLLRDLTHDAARLPGELKDFIGISRSISGAVFAGGGNLEMVRGLTAKVALAAPAAGQSPEDAARQTMRLLFGTASVGDNPLFAMLMGSRLLPGAEQFNALRASERLRLFDEALAKLVDNPMFRENILNTFDTQLGTLADNLVGAQGVLTEMGGRDLFQWLLGGLRELNEFIDSHKDTWVDWANVFRGKPRSEDVLQGADLQKFLGQPAPYSQQGPSMPGVTEYLLGKNARAERDRRVRQRALNILSHEVAAQGLDQRMLFLEAPGAREHFLERYGLTGRFEELRRQSAEEYDKALAAQRAGPEPFKAKDVPQAKIEQHFTIKLDLKSDDAPDSVAVRLVRAMEKLGRHPTTAQRGLSTLPGGSVIKP